ncbi:MAG TPA: diguanylate cyclase, partial [Spirochaetota bacterium]|nr:diguanylate cyclase [Spirochaetota bacterium]
MNEYIYLLISSAQRRMAVPAVICAVLMLFCGCEKMRDDRPRPVQGVLNLSLYDIRKEGVVSLSGEWEFFWNRTYEEAAGSGFSGGFRANLPKLWDSYRIGSNTLPSSGYATYRIVIERGNNSGNLALRLPDVKDSSRVYVNGKCIGETGFFSREYSFAHWAFRPSTYVIDDPAPRLEIAIEVSNHVYAGGGPADDILLGTESQMSSICSTNQRIDFFVFGALLVFGLYHIFKFFMRRDEKSVLYIGLCSLLLALRAIMTGDRFLPGLFPDSVFEFVYGLDPISMLLASVFLLLCIYELYPGIAGKCFRIASIMPALVISAFICVTPTRVHSPVLPAAEVLAVFSCVAGLAVVMIALFRKVNDAFIFIAGFIIMSFAIGNDILYTMRYVDSFRMTSFGICAFLVSLGLIISVRYAKAYRDNIELNMRLESSNRTLESTVAARTAELKSMNEELTEKNAFLNKLTDRLERMAFFDELTRVANKRYFNYCFDSEWKRAARRSEVFSLIMIDIDHFKKFNDTYGHMAGDGCLADVAAALQGVLRRPGDFVARFGGEEFAVLLPGTGREGALAV